MLIAILLLIVTSLHVAVVMLDTMARGLFAKLAQQEPGLLMLVQRILRLALTAVQGLGLPLKVPIRQLHALNAMKERGQL